jgi:hypothetical protein
MQAQIAATAAAAAAAASILCTPTPLAQLQHANKAKRQLYYSYNCRLHDIQQQIVRCACTSASSQQQLMVLWRHVQLRSN